MKCILDLYDYNSNLIVARPMKSNIGAVITEVYKLIYVELTDSSTIPILLYLDNKTSNKKIVSKKRNLITAQHECWLNPAKRAVSTFTNHFNEMLTGCENQFPKYLWCQLVSQSVIVLNMLRKSRIDSKLSAHYQVSGTFNY